MAQGRTTTWLAQKAKLGITELPANAGWLLSKAFTEPADAVETGSHAVRRKARDTSRGVRDAVATSMPFGDGVDSRLASARSAIERARSAEQQALQRAEHAASLVAEAEAVAERGRERLDQARRERDKAIEQRVAEARQRADEQVAKERAQAEEAAGRRYAKVEESVQAERRRAEAKAEAAQADARKEIESAEHQLATAQQQADEAAQAAREAAEQASREARELAAEAEAEAAAVNGRVATARRLSDEVGAETAQLESAAPVKQAAGELKQRTKAELLEVAAGLGIEKRSSMRKNELVSAINRAKRKA